VCCIFMILNVLYRISSPRRWLVWWIKLEASTLYRLVTDAKLQDVSTPVTHLPDPVSVNNSTILYPINPYGIFVWVTCLILGSQLWINCIHVFLLIIIPFVIICNFATHKKLPYLSSNSHAKTKFELNHFDI
jgi:hypothetical protein